MSRCCLLALALALALCLSGCVSPMGDFTLISSKNVEISRVDLKRIKMKKGIEGSDGRFSFLLIPFGRAPSLEEAVDDALETGGGDFMVSTRIYRTSWSVILFGWESYSVEGNVGSSTGEGARNVVDDSQRFDPIPDY